jgi:hypothetical protein
MEKEVIEETMPLDESAISESAHRWLAHSFVHITNLRRK